MRVFFVLTGLLVTLSPLIRFSADLETQLIFHAAVIITLLYAFTFYSPALKTAFPLLSALFFAAAGVSYCFTPEKAVVRNSLITLFDGLAAGYLFTLLTQEKKEKVLLITVWISLWFSFILILLPFLRHDKPFFDALFPDILFINRNVVAGYLVLCFPFSLYYSVTRGKSLRIASVVIFLGIIFTYSRAAIAISVLNACILLCSYNKRLWSFLKYALPVPILYLLYLTALKSGSNGFLAGRLEWWHTAWNMFLANPLYGAGWGSFESLAPVYKNMPGENTAYVHNVILQLLAETGLTGTAAFLLLLVFFFRKADLKNSFHLTAAVAMGGFLAENLFSYSFFIPALSFLFWLCYSVPFSSEAAPRPKVSGAIAVALCVAPLAVFMPCRYFLSSIHLRSGLSAMHQKQAGKAEYEFLRSVKYDPQPPLAYTKLAELCFHEYSEGKNEAYLQKALSLQKEALERSPQRAVLWSDYAWLLRTSGENEKALESMGKACLYDPHNPKYKQALAVFQNKKP